MKSVQAPASAKTSKSLGKSGVIGNKRSIDSHVIRNEFSSTTATVEDVHGAVKCLLHGVRATGFGLGVLTIEDEHFADMVEHDEEYRAMILETMKLMFIQKGYDATCAAFAEKAMEKMTVALAASGGFSTAEEMFAKPVDYSKIPRFDPALFDGVNDLRASRRDADA